jgi:uncharacterized membrane protein required for colicin V production
MGLFDIVLLIILGGFGLFGLWFGLIHTLGSLLGTVAGAYFASRWFVSMVEWVNSVTGWEGNWLNIIMFAIAFVCINRFIGFLFWLVERFFKALTELPFIASINRFLGLFIGIFEGMITLGLIFFFIDKFPVGETFMGWVETSKIVSHTVSTAEILLPLIPEAIKEMESTIGFIGENIGT